VGETSLSRLLAISIVGTLKKDEHILVVKGGSEPLTRELDALLCGHLPAITPKLAPRPITGEVTSTFGHEDVDDKVETMVASVADALMQSDHVEDVFGDDHVIQRDVFRAVRDHLLAYAAEHGGDVEPPSPISVRLETLGYVASTVAKLADQDTLHDALERAAAAGGGELTGFDPKVPEATFQLHADDPDARLELEEAVAEELEHLVDIGVVDLPTIERRFDLPRDVVPGERADLRGRIAKLAAKSLSGCTGSWALEGTRVLRVTVTPLSEQEARAADERVTTFGLDVGALLLESEPPPTPRSPAAAPPSRKTGPKSARPARVEVAVDEEPAPKRTRSPAAKATKASAKKAASSKPPASKPAAEETSRAAPKASTKAPAKRAAKKA
jgi:hypothetical protein